MYGTSCPSRRVKVIVNGTEVPTTNVRTEVSTDAQQSGADITKLTEAYIPMEWDGEDVTSNIRSFDPSSQSQYDKVTIEWDDIRQSPSWSKVHRGFVRGVSGSDKQGVARMIVSDPSALMSAIPFSDSYEKPSPKEVFNDVAETFNENSPFQAAVTGASSRQITGDSGGVGLTTNAIEAVDNADLFEGFPDSGTLGTLDSVMDTKTFKSNVDSCADALNWVTENSGGKWYFSFGGGGGYVLNLVYDDGSQVETFTQREGKGAPQRQRLNNGGSFPNGGGNTIDIIKNTAMQELFPINTLTVKGKQGVSLFGWDVHGPFSDKAPFVTVQYDPLLERAGGNVVSETIEIGAVTLESAEQTAKKKLEQKILDTGTGRMMCYGNGNVRPHDRVYAKPECSDVVSTSLNALPWNVSEVIHEKKATEEMRTTLKTAPIVDPSQMSVTNSEMKEV